MTKPVWINTDNDDGYDVHGPGGYWVGGTAWSRFWVMFGFYR